MKLYSLQTKLDFGDYKGEALKDVFLKDPDYIEASILENPNFVFAEALVEKLEEMQENFIFSDEAVEKLHEKYEIYEEEENEFDDVENFSEDDLKNMGIMDDSYGDEYDEFGDGGGFYDDNYGY
jgi:hypothetical protein